MTLFFSVNLSPFIGHNSRSICFAPGFQATVPRVVRNNLIVQSKKIGWRSWPRGFVDLALFKRVKGLVNPKDWIKTCRFLEVNSFWTKGNINLLPPDTQQNKMLYIYMWHHSFLHGSENCTSLNYQPKQCTEIPQNHPQICIVWISPNGWFNFPSCVVPIFLVQTLQTGWPDKTHGQSKPKNLQ